MSSNSFGHLLKLTTYGESHGISVGGILDGFPSGISINKEYIQTQLARRRPGQSKITTSRNEPDRVVFHSGIFENKSTGTPISFSVQNSNHRSSDYSKVAQNYRPSHADYTYDKKYGFRDYRGGGRSSARVTLSQVVGGSLAQHILWKENIHITAFTSSVGEISLKNEYKDLDFNEIENNIVRCPDADIAKKMINRIEQIKADGDTIGGTITCVIKNCPIGLGEPVFNKLHAQLGFAMLGINAVKGFEIGSGFLGTKLKGSEHNDIFATKGNKVYTKTNFSGGIQGGISNGEDIYFKVAFKPVATLLKDQDTINKQLEKSTINPGGRHDPCVVPRAVPIVESMAALVLADFYLINKARKWE